MGEIEKQTSHTEDVSRLKPKISKQYDRSFNGL